MIFTPAYAQSAGGAGGGDFLVQLMPLVLIFVIFWFLLINPQRKRAKEHKAMISALRRGDQVLTAGGIIGKVSRVAKVKEGEDARESEEIEIEIAENVRVKVYRSTISAVLSKTEPAKEG